MTYYKLDESDLEEMLYDLLDARKNIDAGNEIPSNHYGEQAACESRVVNALIRVQSKLRAIKSVQRMGDVA